MILYTKLIFILLIISAVLASFHSYRWSRHYLQPNTHLDVTTELVAWTSATFFWSLIFFWNVVAFHVCFPVIFFSCWVVKGYHFRKLCRHCDLSVDAASASYHLVSRCWVCWWKSPSLGNNSDFRQLGFGFKRRGTCIVKSEDDCDTSIWEPLPRTPRNSLVSNWDVCSMPPPTTSLIPRDSDMLPTEFPNSLPRPPTAIYPNQLHNANPQLLEAVSPLRILCQQDNFKPLFVTFFFLHGILCEILLTTIFHWIYAKAGMTFATQLGYSVDLSSESILPIVFGISGYFFGIIVLVLWLVKMVKVILPKSRLGIKVSSSNNFMSILEEDDISIPC